MLYFSFMENILLGLKNLTLGIITVLTAVSRAGAVVPQNTPTPLPTPVRNIITRTGEYSYSGYSLKYIVRVNKDGGPITGEFSGVCVGPITGKFAGGSGGNIEGEAKANCKIAIFNYNLKASYTGNLYLHNGLVNINWSGEIPYTANSGSFTVNFESLN